MRRAFTIIAALVTLLHLPVRYLRAEAFRYGIDVLDSSRCEALKGKKTALITNAAGTGIHGEPDYRILLRHGVDLKFLMAPEHGFSISGAAGETVGTTTLSGTLPVYSLYGASKKPDAALLETIDILLFDLQDVGARCYTYISTMDLAMQACASAGVTFMLLDRPNPVAPVPADGFMLQPGFESFVGAVPVPFIHGMTTGEIALWLQKHRYPELSLKVVRMQGYSHKVFADELDGFRFVSPSPNIRNMETAILYPATVFLEATNLSEGRGTDAPFAMFGAPFIDALRLKTELDSFQLPGVEFQPATFTPSTGKFAKEECHGIRMRLTDRRAIEPFRISVALLHSLQKLYPSQLGLERHSQFFDRLAGTSLYRLMLMKQATIGEILDAARAQVHAFQLESADRYLYQ